MRRWLVGLALGIAVAAVTTGFVRQKAPSSPVSDMIGIRSPRPFNRYCGWFVRDTRLGTWPTGEAVCAWYRRDARERRPELDQLKYDVLTRRVRHAGRSWEPLSDTTWRRESDSVRSVFRARGGLPLRVGALTPPDEIRECWRFPTFEVYLYTGRATFPSSLGPAGSRWFLFLHGAPERMPTCEDAEPLPV